MTTPRKLSWMQERIQRHVRISRARRLGLPISEEDLAYEARQREARESVEKFHAALSEPIELPEELTKLLEQFSVALNEPVPPEQKEE